MSIDEAIKRIKKLGELARVFTGVPLRPGVFDPAQLPPETLKEAACISREIDRIKSQIDSLKKQAEKSPAHAWVLLHRLEALESELEWTRLRLTALIPGNGSSRGRGRR